MQKSTIPPDCSLTGLVAAALGTARQAAVALDQIADIAMDPALVARAQRILAGDQPMSEESLEALRALNEALGEAVDAERWWSEPESSAAAIEDLTPQGKQIQYASGALWEAPVAAARAIDRWRAEAIVAAHLR